MRILGRMMVMAMTTRLPENNAASQPLALSGYFRHRIPTDSIPPMEDVLAKFDTEASEEWEEE
jgi:hypothetical protein